MAASRQSDSSGLESDPSRAARLVPKAVVNRLSLYLRELEYAEQAGRETISSSQLGQMLGFTDAQVRKDLTHFGQFGYPGVGYRTGELTRALRQILGINQQWPAVMVGAGNLGRALLGYHGFTQRGFRIVAVLDNDPEKVGQAVENLTVEPLDTLAEIVRERQVSLGLVVVPAAAAQSVADRLVAAGVRGILNFAPATISVPNPVSVVSVDLSVELEQLAFEVLSRQRSTGGADGSSAAEAGG